MLENYFKIAFRNLFRNKVYSLINILGLCIGLACSILILLYVKDEVSYDRFHSNLANIYRVTTQDVDKDGGKGRKDGNTGFLQGPRFARNVPGIKAFVRVRSGHEDIRSGNEVLSQELLRVDSTFFTVFSFPLLAGNANQCLVNPRTVVLSENLAKKQFGTADAVGKSILIKEDSAFVSYKVTAVAKNCPQNSSFKFDMLLPFNASAGDEASNENWFSSFLNTFLLLEPTAGVAGVEKGMQRFYEGDSREALDALRKKYGSLIWFNEYHLQPFIDMHLSEELPAGNGLSDASNPVYSYILSGIALFILLIACINFVNLTIARSVTRAREIGIRKVVGGERIQLIKQFLGESFLLCFIAFLMAIALVQMILPLFNSLANKSLAITYLIDARLIIGFILLFFLTAFLAGFYPALVLSNYNTVQTLYSKFNLGGKNYLQKALVVLQFGLASFLIIATFTIYRQFNFLTTEKLGYDDSNLVMVRKSNLTREEAKYFKEELLKNPAITGVAAKNGGQWGTGAKVNGDSLIQFTYETVDEAFIPLLKIPITHGRNFSPAFPSDSTNSVLVNESFVKKAGWKDPLGQVVNFWYDNNQRYKVIGVVSDHHYNSLNQEIGPQVFTMKAGNRYGLVYLKIKPNSETESLRHVERTFKKLFPTSPYTYLFKNEENLRNYEAEAKWKQIMLYSAILTIFISCIGLFGLSVLSAEKRTKEIGIRKVLGASVRSVVTILSKDFLKLVLIALSISIPAAWKASAMWLENYPYRSPLHWGLFAGAAMMVVMIALLTVSFQAIKAGVANPVRSLRTE